MTDHLPDCDDYAFSGAGYHPKCERICICRQVRRIEKRVLDAAREAVAALDAYYAIEECEGNPLEKGDPEDPDPWHQGHLIERDDALAAIDALKEKP